MVDFTKRVLVWYEQNKRELPWRSTQNAYYIWVSEIILQQTRVNQGLTYYREFVNKFPDIFSLAAASENEVLRIWQGLGYYNRALNMHHTARQLVKENVGQLPDSYKELIKLKGIGPYTAAAIASMAYNEAVAVVDGNVKRVLSRIFGIDILLEKEFTQLVYDKAEELLYRQDPASFNQAIMEFGALYCVPGLPDCKHCIFSDFCFAFRHNQVTSLPPKQKKPMLKKRYFHFFFLNKNDFFYIRQRRSGDIWAGLHELPLIEAEGRISKDRAVALLKQTGWLNSVPPASEITKELEIKHRLTHQEIYAEFYSISLSESAKIQEKEIFKADMYDHQQYAFPKPVITYLEKKINRKR